MSIFGSLINMFGNLADTALQQGYTQENMYLQNRLNKEQAGYSAMLQRHNTQYLSQMSHGINVSGMKNAGMNPATANGVSNNVAMASAPSSGAPGPQGARSNLGQALLQGYMDLSRHKKQNDLLDSQKENVDADTKVKEQQALTEEQKKLALEWQNSDEYRKSYKDVMDAQALQNYSQVDLNQEQVFNIAQKTKNLQSELNLTEVQTKEVSQKVSNLVASYHKTVEEVGLAKAQKLYINALTNYTQKQEEDLRQKNNSGFWTDVSLKSKKERILLDEKITTELGIQGETSARTAAQEFNNAVNEIVGRGGRTTMEVGRFITDVIKSLK